MTLYLVTSGNVNQTEDYTHQLWLPPSMQHSANVQGAQSGAGTTYDEHRARKPPPDLPSIMLDTRIVYLGMPVSITRQITGCAVAIVAPFCLTHDGDCALQLVPAVTELVIAELLYLQHRDIGKPINLYINSTGTTRADGETVCSSHGLCSFTAKKYNASGAVVCMLQVARCPHEASRTLQGWWVCADACALLQVGFETEGTAVYDAMCFLSAPVSLCLVAHWVVVCRLQRMLLNSLALCRCTLWVWALPWGRAACCCQQAPRATASCFLMRPVRH